MKKLISLTLLLASAAYALACTNLIVGKKASTDGSVMCTYNCDGFGFSGSLFYSPSGRHDKDELIAIHGWGPAHEGQFVKQVEYTYNVVGLMNERQVTIVETTFPRTSGTGKPGRTSRLFQPDAPRIATFIDSTRSHKMHG